MQFKAADATPVTSDRADIPAHRSARRNAKRAAAEKAKLQNKLDNFKRQDIINPYEDVQDLSSMLTNPFENIGVATQAAEMQAEEADIALANTLDTLAATGAGAGGATALAQAALRSKKDVSSSICLLYTSPSPRDRG
mgnify:CR=1 FL=1